MRRAFSDVGGRIVLGTPKSHQSRTVPIPRFLAREIAQAVPGKEPDDQVFTMPGGSMLRLPNSRRAVFLSARGRAYISSRFRLHDLRHTAAAEPPACGCGGCQPGGAPRPEGYRTAGRGRSRPGVGTSP